MNCELCNQPIKVAELYIDVKKRIPLNTIYTPEDAAARGIHIRCVAPATAE